ncbi:hypothetical protein [Modestobacter marinus]|uniref:hypothetical protein n=1 Tax=Modestobacter marinus TaxID=477641 RepID=UPI001C98C910|nr:hypothetical protein [Modestobacter marinus]
MADYAVVGDVSTIIVRKHRGCVRGPAPVPPIVEPNDLSDAVPVAVSRLTVFRYDISEDPASRNSPPLRSAPPDQPAVH